LKNNSTQVEKFLNASGRWLVRISTGTPNILTKIFSWISSVPPDKCLNFALS
jgi:hypothetical protein